jgi:hypothetical protein
MKVLKLDSHDQIPTIGLFKKLEDLKRQCKKFDEFLSQFEYEPQLASKIDEMRVEIIPELSKLEGRRLFYFDVSDLYDSQKEFLPNLVKQARELEPRVSHIWNLIPNFIHGVKESLICLIMIPKLILVILFALLLRFYECYVYFIPFGKFCIDYITQGMSLMKRCICKLRGRCRKKPEKKRRMHPFILFLIFATIIFISKYFKLIEI